MNLEAADEESLMAQALGFSSFGAQDRPQKKRRYNPRADAAVFVEHPQSHLPKEFTTGPNSTPVATSSRKEAPHRENADEIALGDEEGDENADDNIAATTAPATAAATDEAVKVSTLPARPACLPPRPGPGTGPIGFGGRLAKSAPRGGRHDEERSRDPWSEGYYDAFSNQNPWERLEKSLGLQSKGTWLAPESRTVVTG